MDSILPILHEYRLIIGLVLSILTTAILLTIWWDKVSFWWLNVWYGFPLIGKGARLASDYESKTLVDNVEWFNSEQVLCDAFSEHYDKVNKDVELFKKSQNYLGKVTEDGRNNLHALGWVLIASLVFVEAMGFSYVLSGFTIPGASESLQQQGALGIAFIISVLLVGLTHFTGHELHANSLINKARIWWHNARIKDGSKLAPQTGITIENTFDDNGQANYQTLVNRIAANGQVKPRYVITIITAIAILVIAVLATYVRGQVLEQMHIEEVALTQTSQSASDDPYAEELPEILVQQQEAAVDKAEDDAWSREQKGGWGTFIFLAFLFVFLQIFGILIGFKTGFAGKHSSAARKNLGDFKTSDQFENYYRREKNQIARVAQKRLKMLQQHMLKKANQNCQDSSILASLERNGARTFLVYMQKQEGDEITHEQIKAAKLKQVAQTAPPQPITPVATIADDKLEVSEAATEETQAEREARIRKDLLAELQAQKAAQQKPETEEEMRERIRRELEAEMS
ncbi:hypothetical protein [Motilimonas sp. KMU-193]|uniref:hypothetical protein n=1 Tax=Motilimonas sp. KMU-193 TaxID=3388668 RepID=UPI00396B072F